MLDVAEKRGQIIRFLEEALALADEIEDAHSGYMIERALDEAPARQLLFTVPRSAMAARGMGNT
jgi:uncharacterized membrane protein (UPF0127 family)